MGRSVVVKGMISFKQCCTLRGGCQVHRRFVGGLRRRFVLLNSPSLPTPWPICSKRALPTTRKGSQSLRYHEPFLSIYGLMQSHGLGRTEERLPHCTLCCVFARGATAALQHCPRP